ncbi:GNAT family N-acetyltransferase [Flexibacterium corallicola]|uniref:GNAT family N-acetyltransferase n=1 Tax=Flexibacterium corallicola TaxID=3037259 RepID=UPI00286EC690|nr:N-acetyltransferase family protein [Pseudovibrio sp. M1P-2-3]
MRNFKIRSGDSSDCQSITDIFNYYITKSYARFETKPFSYNNRLEWLKQFNPGTVHQILVAEGKEGVLGFACSQPYRDDIAFEGTAEVTIYLSPHTVSSGIGTALYTELFRSLSKTGLHRLLSGIALPNDASVELHRKFGFEEIGVFDQYAKKNGKFISSIWLQKLMK